VADREPGQALDDTGHDRRHQCNPEHVDRPYAAYRHASGQTHGDETSVLREPTPGCTTALP